MKNTAFILLAALAFTTGFLHSRNAAGAQQADCTLIVSHETSSVIYEQGDCHARHAPQSTFKIPLAVMGFDSGILKNAHDPVWPYNKSDEANRAEERKSTDPARWQKDSVVWYSQRLTRTIGEDKFRDYVSGFDYGNKDISGDHGKRNGLTNAWLSSSLAISPHEQVEFIQKLLTHNLAASGAAQDLAVSIVPAFKSGEWVVRGKTGTGFHRRSDGTLDRGLQKGWFIGWAEHEGRKVVFATFIADRQPMNSYAGRRARDAFLENFPHIIKTAGGA